MAGNVLVVGAGRVAGPCVKFLLERKCKVTVGSAIPSELEDMKGKYPEISTTAVDVQNREDMCALVELHAIVVCLVPPHLRTMVAEVCIQCGRHFVSATYEDEHMKLLHDKAVAAGVTLLNEAGLDPGIDHAIAMNVIDGIKGKNGEITSFTSMCGGLPAPECSQCPLRYKFSWYPKGMLLSAMKPSKYCRDGKTIHVKAGDNCTDVTLIEDFLDNEVVEVIPNRDCTHYLELYGIETAHSIYRGTARYQGFSKVLKCLIGLGLLSTEESGKNRGNLTWKSYLCEALGIPCDSTTETLKDKLFHYAGQDWAVVKDIEDLGLCEDTPMPNLASPMDALTSCLMSKLSYGPNDRDMVVMRTIVEAQYPDGQREKHTVDLLDFGQVNGYSSMSRTVGITAGVCAHLLLQGAVKRTGTLLPTSQDIYKPLLETLAKENITLKSSIVDLGK